MASTGSTLLISDGDLPALVCMKHASEEMLGEAQGVDGAALWIWQVEPGNALRSATIGRQASLLAAQVARQEESHGKPADLLLAAGRFAAERGIGRVVWPASAGVAGEPESIDVDLAAALANTAMLIERLLEIESRGAPAIDAPMLDLCDRQIADLAVDLGLIPGEVWWTGRSSDEQVLAAERWGAAFESAGVRLRVPQADARRG